MIGRRCQLRPRRRWACPPMPRVTLKPSASSDRDLGGNRLLLLEAKLGELPDIVADGDVGVALDVSAPGDPRQSRRTILHLRLDCRMTGHACTPSRKGHCTEREQFL